MLKLGSEQRKRRNAYKSNPQRGRRSEVVGERDPTGKDKTRSDQLQRILHGWAQQEKVKITCVSLSKIQYTQKNTKNKKPTNRTSILYFPEPVLYRRTLQTLGIEFLTNNNFALMGKLMMNTNYDDHVSNYTV